MNLLVCLCLVGFGLEQMTYHVPLSWLKFFSILSILHTVLFEIFNLSIASDSVVKGVDSD